MINDYYCFISDREKISKGQLNLLENSKSMHIQTLKVFINISMLCNALH